MKTHWSVISSLLLLLFLTACGKEQFGTVPQTTTSNPDPVQAFQQVSCSTSTLVKPKVDILYVVDNSGSAFYLGSEIRTALTNTVNTVSSQFDYRVIGATLIPTTSPYDYQVMTNSNDALPDPGKKIISPSQFTFFQNPGQEYVAEKGLGRTIDFINNTGSLFRNTAHLIVVLVSNGRDTEVETDPAGDGNTVQTALFQTRLNSFNLISQTKSLAGIYFKSVTAKTACQSGWRSSLKSYVAMASALSGQSFDLCTRTVSGIFSDVNSSIQQQVIPHTYRYWPITFASNSTSISSFSGLQVYKVSGNNSPVLLSNSSYQYYDNTSAAPALNLLTTTNPSEVVTGKRHFIRFNSGSEITFPDCVQIRSTSKTEYFGYVLMPKEPKPGTISLRINGQVIPQSGTNGWTYVGYRMNQNIKVAYPNAGDDQPPVLKSGYMLQLNGINYKSGDSVEVNYLPAGV